MEFEKLWVQKQALRKIAIPFRGICISFLDLNRDLERCQHVNGWSWKDYMILTSMPKNILRHYMIPNPKSQVWYRSLHGNTFWRWALGLVLRLGSSKNLDPILNTSLTNIYAQNNQAPTSMIITRISMFSWGSNVGTWDPMWTGPNYLKHIEGFPQIPLEWRYNSWKYGFKYCKESLEWKIK